jgi:hypothetical protein
MISAPHRVDSDVDHARDAARVQWSALRRINPYAALHSSRCRRGA